MKIKTYIMKSLFLAIILTLSLGVRGQDYFSIQESQDENGNYKYSFFPKEAVLHNHYPLDGPDAFYTYFWSFGDGHYSFEKTPSHIYSISGEVEIMMIATPRYSGTPPPPSFSSTHFIDEGNTTYPAAEQMLLLDRDPRPEYTSHAIINYQNKTDNYINNAILRLYFREDYFQYQESIVFHGELPSSIQFADNLMPRYSAYVEYQVGDLSPNEARTLFARLETNMEAFGPIGEELPQLFLKAELICQNGCEVLDGHGNPVNINNQIIQSSETSYFATGSWDPNSKKVSQKELVYDQLSDASVMGTPYPNLPTNKLTYRIDFQNIGSGPAKNVTIKDVISTKLDITTLKVVDFYHPNINITDAHSIFISSDNLFTFIFHNINLEGLNQPGANPANTKGYLVFEIEVDNQNLVFNPSGPILSCTPIDSIENDANIIFDVNPPITTNKAVTKIYASSLANCLGSNSPQPTFTIIPNPVENNEIVVHACNLPLFFEQNAIFRIIHLQNGILNCNLNLTVGQEDSNGCNTLRFNPSGCLTSGYHVLSISYFGNTYNVNFLVN